MSTQEIAVAVELPNTLSALLRLAIADVKLVEQDPRYRLDMNWYHQPAWDQFDGVDQVKCLVCLAGAVMVRELHAPIEQELIPQKFGGDVAAKLRAIDAMRAAQFVNAYEHLSDPMADCARWTPAWIPPVVLQVLEDAKTRVQADWLYSERRAEDWSTYLAAADILEQAGL